MAVAGCQWRQEGECVECRVEPGRLPPAGLAHVPRPCLCSGWHQTQERTQGKCREAACTASGQRQIPAQCSIFISSTLIMVLSDSVYTVHVDANISSYNIMLHTQCQYELLPPSLARFSPSDPDIILYTGYGMEKCVQFYSISQKTVLRTYALTHWATCMDISPLGHLITLGCSGIVIIILIVYTIATLLWWIVFECITYRTVCVISTLPGFISVVDVSIMGQLANLN